MINREILKSEIDKVNDIYLETLYRIIKAFEYIPVSEQDFIKAKSGEDENEEKKEWLSFINSTYGCLSDDPIRRGEQGEFEIRGIID